MLFGGKRKLRVLISSHGSLCFDAWLVTAIQRFDASSVSAAKYNGTPSASEMRNANGRPISAEQLSTL